jgi:hypothetical protein
MHGSCPHCGVPSRGKAVRCWQCGGPLPHPGDLVHLYPGAAVIGILLVVFLIPVTVCWPDFAIITFLFHYTAGLRVLVLFSRGRVGLTYGTGLAILLKFFESFGIFLLAAILALALTIPGMMFVIPLIPGFLPAQAVSGVVAIWSALAVIIYTSLLRKEWWSPRERTVLSDTE